MYLIRKLPGHLRSWSATQKYIDTYQNNPVETLREKLITYWRNEEEKKEVIWKLILKVGKYTPSYLLYSNPKKSISGEML